MKQLVMTMDIASKVLKLGKNVQQARQHVSDFEAELSVVQAFPDG